MHPAFRPKQAMPLAHATEFVQAFNSQATRSIITYTLQSLLSPLSPASIIHDNGCGEGAVTSAIMDTHPAAVTIHATDADPGMVAVVRNLAAERSWPVQTALSAAEALPYPADFFSLPFSAFVLPLTANGGLDAARELHRTLKPGGSAVISNWAVVPNFAAINAAHATSRAASLPPPPQFTAEQYSAQQHSLLTQAGFADSKVTLQTRPVEMETGELQHWAQAMWSRMGASSAGRQRGDEERWDEAIAVIVSEMRKSDRFTAAEAGGGGQLRHDVHIAVAVK